MAGKPKEELSEKHWKALRLIEDGVARKDVAAQMGWGVDYFKHLCMGDVQTNGLTADLFKKELQKIEQKQDEEAKVLIRENTVTAQSLIKRSLKDYETKKKLTADDKSLIATLTNALTKSKPSLSIKNLSYSYTTGLTPEELIHEFTKLKSIAESSFDRRRVQVLRTTGPGTVSATDEPGSGLAEDS